MSEHDADSTESLNIPRVPLTPVQQEVGSLIDAFSDIGPMRREIRGPVVVRVREATWHLEAVVIWEPGGGTVELDAGAGEIIRALEDKTYGRLLSAADMAVVAAVDGSWIANDAVLRSFGRRVNTREQTVREYAHFDFDYFAEGASVDHEVPARILVFGGVAFERYPQAFPLGRKRHGVSADGFITTVFGRRAVLRKLHEVDGADLPFCAVAYEGKRLDAPETRALLLLLSFLAGRNGSVEAEIALDRAGFEVGRKMHWSGTRVGEARPPIGFFYRSGDVSNILPEAFPSMLDTALALYKQGINYDIALLHLLADHRRVLDVEIRDITLALDSLIESHAFATKEANLLRPDKYESLLTIVAPAVEHAVRSAGYGDTIVRRLNERLKGANDISHSQRRRAFWKRVGFEPNKKEEIALSHRHRMSHAGFVTKSDNVIIERLARDVLVARTFLNRVLLSLLEYRGEVLDYRTGQNQGWPSFLSPKERSQLSNAPKGTLRL